jgi:hypothetical protein
MLIDCNPSAKTSIIFTEILGHPLAGLVRINTPVTDVKLNLHPDY